MATLTRSMRKLSKARPPQQENITVLEPRTSVSPENVGAFAPVPAAPHLGNESLSHISTPATLGWSSNLHSSSISFQVPPSPPPSPTRSLRRSQSPVKRDSKAISAVAGWFQGESTPLSIGVAPRASDSTRTSSDETRTESSTTMFPSLSRRPTLSRTNSPTKSSSGRGTPRSSRFSLVNTYLNLTKPSTPEPQFSPNLADDSWIKMSLEEELCRHEMLSGRLLSVDDVIDKADDLFSQLQAAYRERSQTAVEAEAKVASYQDELEEANMRTECLKQQLDKLSAEKAERDEVIRELGEKLAAEKESREATIEARARTVRLVEESHSQPEEPPAKRYSWGSSTREGDSESDDESVGSYESSETGCDSPASSNTSISSSARIGCARQTSVARVSATIVRTNSVRAKICNDEPPKEPIEDANHEREPQSAQLGSGKVQHSKSRSMDRTFASPNHGGVFQQRNMFLEHELDAIGQMIDTFLLEVPKDTGNETAMMGLGASMLDDGE